MLGLYKIREEAKFSGANRDRVQLIFPVSPVTVYALTTTICNLQSGFIGNDDIIQFMLRV